MSEHFGMELFDLHNDKNFEALKIMLSNEVFMILEADGDAIEDLFNYGFNFMDAHNFGKSYIIGFVSAIIGIAKVTDGVENAALKCLMFVCGYYHSDADDDDVDNAEEYD